MPNCLVDEMVVNETSILLLPGADTWNDPKHGAVIEKAGEFLSSGALVCAICGATAALANIGLLDNRPHTSNGPGFLEMVSPGYKGQSFYIDKPSVADNNLIRQAVPVLCCGRNKLLSIWMFSGQTHWKPGINILVQAIRMLSLP